MKSITHVVRALFLVLVHIATTSSSSSTTTSFNAATSFITFTCRSATYPKLCEHTCLPFAANITVDLNRMAHYALNSALGAAKSTSWTVHQSSNEKRLKPSTKDAIEDCIRLTVDSVAQIKKSLGELDDVGNGRRFKLMNVRTWMSAAMANYQTCTEGLEEVNASVSVKRSFSKRIRYTRMLSSNALAIVNKIK